jgi:hypothetical protein
MGVRGLAAAIIALIESLDESGKLARRSRGDAKSPRLATEMKDIHLAG